MASVHHLLRLAAARREEDFDEMEKLQKDIEKINREINISKVLIGLQSFEHLFQEVYNKNYGNLSDLNKRNKSLNVQLDMQVDLGLYFTLLLVEFFRLRSVVVFRNRNKC